jgi:hypothetical protein
MVIAPIGAVPYAGGGQLLQDPRPLLSIPSYTQLWNDVVGSIHGILPFLAYKWIVQG